MGARVLTCVRAGICEHSRVYSRVSALEQAQAVPCHLCPCSPSPRLLVTSRATVKDPLLRPPSSH